MADTVAKNSLLGMAGVGATSGCSHCRIEVSTLKLNLTLKLTLKLTHKFTLKIAYFFLI